jgi:hypothetical protein
MVVVEILVVARLHCDAISSPNAFKSLNLYSVEYRFGGNAAAGDAGGVNRATCVGGRPA